MENMSYTQGIKDGAAIRLLEYLVTEAVHNKSISVPVDKLNMCLLVANGSVIDPLKNRELEVI